MQSRLNSGRSTEPTQADYYQGRRRAEAASDGLMLSGGEECTSSISQDETNFLLPRGNCLLLQICMNITAADAFHIGILSAIEHLVTEQNNRLPFRLTPPLLP